LSLEHRVNHRRAPPFGHGAGLGDAGVVAWISKQRQEDCFLNVVSIGEF
jgi:hypothetical protein